MSVRRKILVVLFFVSVCAGLPVTNYYLHTGTAEIKPADLYNVVYSQLKAFRAEDYNLAYSQASFGLQQKFNAEQFADMMRQEYTDIAHSASVEFGMVVCRNEHASIQVFFIGRDGSVVPCIYSLVHEENVWKIEGVRMLPRQPFGAQVENIRA